MFTIVCLCECQPQAFILIHAHGIVTFFHKLWMHTLAFGCVAVDIHPGKKL